jgi:hypothetical protein
MKQETMYGDLYLWILVLKMQLNISNHFTNPQQVEAPLLFIMITHLREIN